MNKLLSWLTARPTRPVWALVVVLLLLNLSLLSWVMLAPSVAAARPSRAVQPAGRTFLIDTLHLSANQRARYDSLRTRYFVEVKPLTQLCRQECQRYYLLLDSSQLSDPQLAARARGALASKVAVDVLTVRHLQQVAALCSPTQRQTLRQVLAPDCSVTGCRPGEMPWIIATPIP
jgi:hypothetical protein